MISIAFWSTAHDGHPRGLSTVHVIQVQEKWSQSQWQTEPLLPRLWAPVRPVLRAISHLGGKAWAHRTLAGGTDFVTGHLSRGGGHTQVAFGVSRPVLR